MKTYEAEAACLYTVILATLAALVLTCLMATRDATMRSMCITRAAQTQATSTQLLEAAPYSRDGFEAAQTRIEYNYQATLKECNK